mgnify:CR=1 FL=1
MLYIYLPKVEDVIRNRRSIELQVPNDNRPLLYLKPMSRHVSDGWDIFKLTIYLKHIIMLDAKRSSQLDVCSV